MPIDERTISRSVRGLVRDEPINPYGTVTNAFRLEDRGSHSMPIDDTDLEPSITCRCGARGFVHRTLTTPFAQYWRCAKCGEVWSSERKRVDVSAPDEVPVNALHTVQKFLLDTRTIVTGAVLGSMAVLYVLRRNWRRRQRDAPEEQDESARLGVTGTSTPD